MLVENAGHLVEKDRLLREVWRDTFVEEANLNRGISALRKAPGETAAERYIETVPKRGYRFVAVLRAGSCEPGVPVHDPDERPGAPASIARRRAFAVAALTVGIVAVAAVFAVREKNGRGGGLTAAASPCTIS